MTSTSRGPVHVLLVEPNPRTCDDIRRAFDALPRENRLTVAEDGQAAVALLRGEGSAAGAVRPDLVMISLNLYGIDATDILDGVRSDPELRDAKVCLMTHSDDESAMLRRELEGVDLFLAKPIGAQQLADALGRADLL